MRLDEKRIDLRIQFIKDNLVFLRELAARSEAEFEVDRVTFYAAVHALQISIEAMLDIFSHISARLHLGVPANDKELLDAVLDKKLISEQHHRRYFQMNKFRNKVVHGYLDVDAKKVYGMLQDDLGDFDMFFEDIGRIVASEQAQNRNSQRKKLNGKK